MKQKQLFIFSTLLCMILMQGCANKVTYGDAQAEETLTADFGSTDLQRIAEKMVGSMLSFPPVMVLTQNKRPVIMVSRINNKTSEHIDTESITDSISNQLLRSGRFRFVDMTRVEDVKKQLNYQNNAGMVNPSKAIRFGRQVGAQYMLYGNLSSIVKNRGSNRDVYMKMTMRLMDLESGLIEWSDEKEIRKVQEKTLFGL
jgi:uncharacterized protein (TIGR02722 family)